MTVRFEASHSPTGTAEPTIGTSKARPTELPARSSRIRSTTSWWRPDAHGCPPVHGLAVVSLDPDHPLQQRGVERLAELDAQRVARAGRRRVDRPAGRIDRLVIRRRDPVGARCARRQRVALRVTPPWVDDQRVTSARRERRADLLQRPHLALDAPRIDEEREP
jgi:hypothetical protein